MWFLYRLFLSSVFLFGIVLSIPVAFDVGGRDSGLAYSLALFTFYLGYSVIEAVTPPSSRIRWSVAVLYRLSQWVVVPALLIWSLGQFAVDADNHTSWIERTLHSIPGREASVSWSDWIFGQGGVVETVTLGGWDNMLRYSSPVFQLLEGFCSLLVIQAAGQITRWLVNSGRSDSWVIVFMVFSASVISSAVYFLWRVALFPQIDTMDAILIGATIASTVFLTIYGISSGRGNPVESSLLIAYVVLCIYQIFTDYQPSSLDTGVPTSPGGIQQPEFPPLPPMIMASYSTLLHLLGALPTAVFSALSFLYAAFQTITPSVIISLAYRVFVFYCTTRIIPAVRDVGAQALLEESALADSADGANRILTVLSWFSPSILIAIYTSLLLQHFTTSDGPEGWTLRGADTSGNVWRWVNIVGTLLLYLVELRLAEQDSHWKVD